MAPKRRLRRKACEGKVRFETLADAREAMKRMIDQGKVAGRLNAYKCPFCKNFYHIGHLPQGFYKARPNYL